VADDCEQLSIASERLRDLQTHVLVSFVIDSNGVHARALYPSGGVCLVDRDLDGLRHLAAETGAASRQRNADAESDFSCPQVVCAKFPMP
jgi:hypothetical protein